MSLIPGTNVASGIAPFDTADKYPTHDEKYGLGGYRSVEDIAARNAIPIERRKAGMLVKITSTGEVFELGADLTTWTSFIDTMKETAGRKILTDAERNKLANLKQSDIAGLIEALLALAPKESPALTGSPTAPTAAPGTNTTQLANTAFVQAALAALVNASPAQLDTLNELAAALGNDANFAATMTAALAGKATTEQGAKADTALQPGAGVDQLVETDLQKILSKNERSIINRLNNTLEDGTFYYLYKQVISAEVDSNLIPAEITYINGVYSEFRKNDGSFSKFSKILLNDDWSFDATQKYYLNYRQVDYTFVGQDLRPTEARLLDGSSYKPPEGVAAPDWESIKNLGRQYVGYSEIQYAVVDKNLAVGFAIKINGNVYDPTEAPVVVPPPTPALCLGDSITAGPYPEALAALSGRTVSKLAIGGQTSRHIVGRASAVAYRLTAQDNQIANGVNAITAINGAPIVGIAGISSSNVQFLSTGSGNATYTATGWLGSVHGTLTRTATGGPPSTAEAYSFTPDAGYALPMGLPPETPFIVDMKMDDRVIIAWLGRNNAQDVAQVLADNDAVFRRFGGSRLVLMNPLNGNYPTERATASNRTGYDYYRQIENTLAEKYPRNFLNIRRKIIDLGLGMLNITPTSQDLIDIADDTVPQSLRADNVHPTTLCYQQVIAPIVNAHLIEKGL